jgi:hypothetical protein
VALKNPNTTPGAAQKECGIDWQESLNPRTTFKKKSVVNLTALNIPLVLRGNNG